MLLVFLAIGLLAGEDGPGGIQFSAAPVAYLLGGLALAIILVDSGFNTRLKSFRNAAAPAIVLATSRRRAHGGRSRGRRAFSSNSPTSKDLLIGSIVGSTDAAVFFLLRVGGITIRSTGGRVQLA